MGVVVVTRATQSPSSCCGSIDSTCSARTNGHDRKNAVGEEGTTASSRSAKRQGKQGQTSQNSKRTRRHRQRGAAHGSKHAEPINQRSANQQHTRTEAGVRTGAGGVVQHQDAALAAKEELVSRRHVLCCASRRAITRSARSPREAGKQGWMQAFARSMHQSLAARTNRQAGRQRDDRERRGKTQNQDPKSRVSSRA